MMTHTLLTIGTFEVVLIAVLIVLLFGGKKIPELMKGLGKGVKSFKQGVAEAEAEVKKIQNEIEKSDETSKNDK
jgi:sec-independent protein translocase protein TatA